jgi:hypothetical protein
LPAPRSEKQGLSVTPSAAAQAESSATRGLRESMMISRIER